jgi:malate dehydrogenase (oxaloacetate-decarboxylating)
MEKISVKLENLGKMFPDNWSQEQIAKGKTLFLKKLSETAHKHYSGKIQTVPKVPVPGFNWFNVWYTPGVSKVSTNIRDNNDCSFELSNRGNLVAVVSDSTRVLGDGDCTPPGGLGVMEGKAFLMKYLGGVDGVALCIDSKGKDGKNDPDKIIEFVKMCQHSFGAINLEDISQPNCFKVLDVLREECDIPVWHDDAQGTACVTLAGLINALKLTKKKLSEAKIVLYGAGASNTTIARLIIADGGDPSKMVLFDTKGTLHKNREDIKSDPRFYRKWELCESTNPNIILTMEDAMKDADVLISLSTPGPDTIKKEWVSLMAEKSIVFACANPVPEIYPYAAKEAGAYIVATGRGDFPNQVNNSLGFPGILKGALIVRAQKITDNMAIAAAHSLANYAEKRGINPENITPTMDEADVFPVEAADVAMQAIKDGVARKKNITWQEAYDIAKKDIEYSRSLCNTLSKEGYIEEPPAEMLQNALDFTIKEIEG